MSRLVVAIGHVEFTIANQTLYVVTVQQDADEWDVRRTYSDFRKLREDVARVMHDNRASDACSHEFAVAAGALAFPAKKLFGSRRDRVVRGRAVELHQFLIRLLLLTHTYRKAQKQLYDNSSSSSSSAHVVPVQQQASAHVFYLLRDFLKPLNAGLAHAIEDENDESARRMIRESKMLTMRSSGHQAATKSMSAPNVLSYSSSNYASATSAQAQTSSQQQQQDELVHPALYRKQSTIPLLEEAPASTSSKKTLSLSSLMSRSMRTDSNASDRSNPLTAADSRARNVSGASATYPSSSSRKQSAASDVTPDAPPPQQQPVLPSFVQGRKVSSASATAMAPVNITPSSSSSSSSSVSSSVYIHGSAPSSSSSGAASRAYPPSSNTSSQPSQLTLYDSDDHVPKNRRTKHNSVSTSSSGQKKTTTGLSPPVPVAARSKTRSVSARDLRTSERKSKLSPQLTAQAVTINAQKELERYLSEYSAIMILRYVDRFISKAATKAPGCYTVSAQRKLVIDSERFLEELDETFKDLPANFESNFRNPYAGGDWFFPPALDAYVQMKWGSFQGHSASSSSSSKPSKSSGKRGGRRGSDSEDDSEESESEYEEISGGGGYMKSKKMFTEEEADELDKMIADGTAGRDQMLRLRRQMNESGWNRRAHPSGGAVTLSASFNNGSSSSSNKPRKKKVQVEYWTDTDDDETRQTGSSGGEDQTTVEHYQQKYNALRKERLSRREGGLV